MQSTIRNQHDIKATIRKIRKDLNEIRRDQFDLRPVTELSTIKGIFFDIKHTPQLKEMGVLSKFPDREYGYFRSNMGNAKVNNALLAADDLLYDILNFLSTAIIRPKPEYSETLLSRFEVIEGDYREPWFVSLLKEGAL